MMCAELQVGNQSATRLSWCASSRCYLPAYTGVVYVDYVNMNDHVRCILHSNNI